MGMIDWLVLALYVITIIAIGIRANRQQTDTESYFLGKRNLPWWAVGLSIIATSFSAASILGMPGWAYKDNLWYLQFSIGDLAAAGVVCLLFIPFYHRLKLTTAYEFLEFRFDLKTRLLGSVLFLLTVLLRAGSLLYGAALLISEVAPSGFLPGSLDPTEEAVVLFGVIAIIYTFLGGITAVVWTDVIQFLMISVGIIGCMVVVSTSSEGGLTHVLAEANSAEKLQVFRFDIKDPFMFKGIITAIFGYGLLALSLFGTNQQPVQRYMSVKNPSSAKKALMLGAFSGAIGVGLSLLLGVFLWVFYAQNPGLLPDGVITDKIVPIFINSEVPQFLKGILVAAVFAAAMSSLDSALNSMATAGVVDFYQRLSRKKPDEKKKMLVAKTIVIVSGIISIAIGIYASRLAAQEEKGLIQLIINFMSYFAGGILGLFMLGMLCRRSNGNGAFFGAAISILLVLMLSEKPPFGLPEIYPYLSIKPIPWIWFTFYELILTMGLGYLISLAGPKPGQEQLSCLSNNS